MTSGPLDLGDVLKEAALLGITLSPFWGGTTPDYIKGYVIMHPYPHTYIGVTGWCGIQTNEAIDSTVIDAMREHGWAYTPNHPHCGSKHGFMYVSRDFVKKWEKEQDDDTKG